MNRSEAFESLAEHAWLGRLFAKLSKAELELARRFLWENAQLDRSDFEIALNRYFLDRPKPKNHRLILELLSNANSLAG